MGRTKPKFPIEIILEFFILVDGQEPQYIEWKLQMYEPILRFSTIRQIYQKQIILKKDIQYQTVMSFIESQYQKGQIYQVQTQIDKSFQISIEKILQQYGGKFTIIIQNYLQNFKNLIDQRFQRIQREISEINQRLNQLPTKQDIQQIRRNSLPVLHHNQSNKPIIQEEKRTIDLGILFSQPIFDQITKKTAATPVDFRSEIQRLHIALKSSLKPDITLKCQIATKQNLRHLIKYQKPKILHIICHGTRNGSLQFQDDSKTVLGTLQMVQTQQIKQILKNNQQNLPHVVFVNSCHSEIVGKVFFQMGVNYVIMIQSQDTIQDSAAQIFSQHFYRNIFSGEKIFYSFTQAKQRVKLKHNSFNCCCRHSAKQTHKQNCRWSKMILKKIQNTNIVDEFQKQQIHKLFHVPSEQCKCQLKFLNRHALNCQWAKQSLFNINNDFRIMDKNGVQKFPSTKTELPKYAKNQLVICCCFNYQGLKQGQKPNPHSQSNKFKILCKDQDQKQSESLFNIVPSPYKQINDYTSPQLLQTHQKLQDSIYGRQKQIYDFMKRIKDLQQSIYIVYGRLGVGRTSFSLKCVRYLIQRKVFQMYVHIDLYGIKDKDIFRYKFNQKTKFNYNGEIKMNQVKNKHMIIVLDNADDFFQFQSLQLYQQLQNLRNQLHKSKIIINLKTQNANSFNIQKIHCQKFCLQPLQPIVAKRLIYTKMRHLFDLTIRDSQIQVLVKSNQSLRIPKMIQSICQSFVNSKNKIKIEDIKNKLQQMKDGDATLKIIQLNLNTLKQKSLVSYQLLLFITQFSQGISINDFKMLSYYDKKDSKLHLPIGQNWEKDFLLLFEKYKIQNSNKQLIQSKLASRNQSLTLQNEIIPQLKNHHSIMVNSNDKSSINQVKQNIFIIKGESYFLDQVNQNRFIVKRYIRDYIWKKHLSASNFYMKFVFVGYMSVLLQIYFKWQVQSKYLHEDLIEYSAISQTGLFGLKNSIFDNLNFDITASMRLAHDHHSQMSTYITEKHTSIFEKIKKSDSSSFIANHKQDFINIYQKNWDQVYNHLKEKNNRQQKILIGYLQNLMIFIPTAFMIAKVQTSLLKYIISKSISFLNKLRFYSEDKKILILQLKLQLMKATIDLQKVDNILLTQQLQFNKENTIKLMEKMEKSTIQLLKKDWRHQKNYILMYKQYISQKTLRQKDFAVTNIKNQKSYVDKSKLSNDKLKIMLDHFCGWIKQDWIFDKDQIQMNKLTAKRNLLLGLLYINLVNCSSTNSTYFSMIKGIRQQNQKKIMDLVIDSINKFKSYNELKLHLRAKLTSIQLYTMQLNQIKKNNVGQSIQFYEELSQRQRQIIQCQRIYTDRKNNLNKYAQFQTEIKFLKKLLKQRLWQMSSNTLVCMRAVPITDQGQNAIIQNLSRKKNKFRKQIQTVINPEIDLCSKFQILTKYKLKQQVENGCTILFLSADVKIENKIPKFVFQGQKTNQDLVIINEQFVKQFDMSKIKILIIAGKNAQVGINQLAKILNNPPFMISLSKKNVINQIQAIKCQQEDEILEKQNQYLRTIQQRRKAQIRFLKQFMRNLFQTQKISSKQQIVKLCNFCKQLLKQWIDVQIQYQKRSSHIQIIRKKGSYKDLSPGYQKNHNIDMKLKPDNSNNFLVLKRWKQTYRIFQYLQKLEYMNKHNQQNIQAAVINVFGDIGSGKSLFVQQIARMLVQREKFPSGVFIIDGKYLQKKYQSDFQTYFNKQSEIGKIITLQDFYENADQRFMLIIDDFNAIKPKSNGRMQIFMQKIIQKKVNLIIVTQQIYVSGQSKNESKSIQFNKIKPIKLNRLTMFEINLISYNILDFSNSRLFQKYLQFKKSKNNSQITVKDIYELKNNFYTKKKGTDLLNPIEQMKKNISYQV